jgi:beta-mannosidase
VKARVPGSIYSDLLRDSVLKEDLYYENNDINYRWVSYDNWTFERTFEGFVNLIKIQKTNT